MATVASAPSWPSWSATATPCTAATLPCWWWRSRTACWAWTLQGMGCEEVALEAEVTNVGALRLYERLGFVRDKRLKRYYLNGSDAFRLKLLLPLASEDAAAAQQLDALSLTQAPYTP
ncbi:hypothetical protein ACKKBF_B37525 [Auxenochlorella protothecoides x Auxenochlorella symbiontica]